MNFENIMVASVFFLYMGAAISYACKQNWPWALIWLSYAVANLL